VGGAGRRARSAATERSRLAPAWAGRRARSAATERSRLAPAWAVWRARSAATERSRLAPAWAVWPLARWGRRIPMISNEGPRTGPGCSALSAPHLSTLEAFPSGPSEAIGASRTRPGPGPLLPHQNLRREASAAAVPRRRPHGRGPRSCQACVIGRIALRPLRGAPTGCPGLDNRTSSTVPTLRTVGPAPLFFLGTLTTGTRGRVTCFWVSS